MKRSVSAVGAAWVALAVATTTPQAPKNDGEFIQQRAARFVQEKPRIGDPAPDFKARDEKGRTVRLSDLRGRYVVLQFGCLT